MKQLLITVIILVGLFGCKETPKNSKQESDISTVTVVKAENDYPSALQQVLEAHGGIENWKEMGTLTFDIVKSTGNESHTVDLYSRSDKIEMPEATLGFDGKEVWLHDPEKKYKGNPAVYHNLMFYFYAMPFVLADPGINYRPAKDLVYQGQNYPGIQISYESGIGASPKDDYYLHYDPESYRMAWLGYTFTYGSDKKSDDVRWIRYDDWASVAGLLLPKSITWHNYEGREIKEAKDPVKFDNISLDKTSRPETFYSTPKNAKVVLKH